MEGHVGCRSASGPNCGQRSPWFEARYLSAGRRVGSRQRSQHAFRDEPCSAGIGLELRGTAGFIEPQGHRPGPSQDGPEHFIGRIGPCGADVRSARSSNGAPFGLKKVPRSEPKRSISMLGGSTTTDTGFRQCRTAPASGRGPRRRAIAGSGPAACRLAAAARSAPHNPRSRETKS